VLEGLELDLLQLAAQAQQRLGAAGQVQVAAAVLVQHLKKGVDLGHGLGPPAALIERAEAHPYG